MCQIVWRVVLRPAASLFPLKYFVSQRERRIFRFSSFPRLFSSPHTFHPVFSAFAFVMIALSILSAVALVPLMVAARDVPVFTLDCSAATGYPEACDTHWYAPHLTPDGFVSYERYCSFAAACSGSGTRGGNNFRDVAKWVSVAILFSL